MLLSFEATKAVTEIVKPQHFYRPNHGDIFECVTHLVRAGEPVDPLTMADELSKRSLLKRIGGAPYLVTLQQACPSPASAAAYARIVYDKWRQRSIIDAGQRLVQLGHEDATTPEEVDELLSRADTLMRDLGEPAQSGRSWDELVSRWRQWQSTKADVIYTPWPELNEWFPGGGFHAGQLVIVGGRPGQGKSNAGLNIVLGAAEHGRKTTIFSVEMDDVEVCSRLLAAGAWTKVGQIFSKKMETETRERIEDYIAGHKGMPLEVIDEPRVTVERVISHCRLSRPDVLFVDYSQLISPTDNRLVREQQVAHITRSLKIAAKSLQMVVVLASQVKRVPMSPGKPDPAPRIDDLRESGAAEQDADIVILLHRLGNSRNVKAIVGKNRNGPTGEATLVFRGELARIG